MAMSKALGESVYSVYGNCSLSCYDSLLFLLLLDSKELGNRLLAACWEERWQDAVHLIKSGK